MHNENKSLKIKEYFLTENKLNNYPPDQISSIAMDSIYN